MSRISYDNDPPEGPLNVVGRPEQPFRSLDGLEYPVVVADHSAQVDRHHGLGPFSNGTGHLAVVHLIGAGSAVHHHRTRAHMAYRTCRSRICVGRDNDLVTRSHTDDAQRHLHAGSRRVEAHSPGSTAAHRNKMFELFSLRPGGNPPRAQHLRHHGGFRLRHVGRGEWDVPHN